MSLDIDGIRFGYGAIPVFSGLSAAGLVRGDVTALIGPNGVGKSSLFRLISGMAKPAAGTIRLDGSDLADVPARKRSERVFLLTQHAAIRAILGVFDVVLLARKSLRTGRGADDLRRVEEVLDALGIDNLADRPVSDLSGGQQQLVCLAQALVREPDVLLLDEPTSALDLRRQLEVMELVRDMTRQRKLVTIVALHDLSLASRFADRFLLLHEGRIAADGTAETVLSDPQAQAAYRVGIRLERTSRGELVVDPYLM